MSDLKISIHPIVLIHITDHITKASYKNTKACGGLVGKVTGKNIEVFYGFEIKNDDGVVDKELVSKKYNLFTRNFESLVIVGIYNLTKEKEPGTAELNLVKQVSEPANRDLEVCITCDPKNITKERPVGLYQIKKNTFLPISLNLATTEQERICLDVILDPSLDGETSGAERYTEQISGLIDDLNQLKQKVGILLEYLKNYKNVPLENRNFDIIRKISTAVHLLPQKESSEDDSSSFSLPFFSRLSESEITIALAALTQNLNISQKTADFFEIVDASYRQHEHGGGGGMRGFGPGMGMGMPGMGMPGMRIPGRRHK